MFDPQPHLVKLPRKVKDRATGHYTTVYDDYLEVKWRLVMFRERYPHGVITTEEICVDLDRGYARYKATVADGQGGTATGYGTETAADFADYCERAETRALGRALAALGIGTQFVGQDLSEMPHVVDSPVVSTNGQAVTAVTSPTEAVEADVPDVPPPTPTAEALPAPDHPGGPALCGPDRHHVEAGAVAHAAVQGRSARRRAGERVAAPPGGAGHGAGHPPAGRSAPDAGRRGGGRRCALAAAPGSVSCATSRCGCATCPSGCGMWCAGNG
jgi:hypothetical protein